MSVAGCQLPVDSKRSQFGVIENLLPISNCKFIFEPTGNQQLVTGNQLKKTS